MSSVPVSWHGPRNNEAETEPLGLLLLPCRLEDFQYEAHVRNLLAIPRVVAIEPSRFRAPRMMRDSVYVRQARRLRFPGEPRLLVLYDPRQYPLARALGGRYERAELWYARPAAAAPEAGDGEDDADLQNLDQLARERAHDLESLGPEAAQGAVGESLWGRLAELGIISQRAFVPGARIHAR